MLGSGAVRINKTISPPSMYIWEQGKRKFPHKSRGDNKNETRLSGYHRQYPIVSRGKVFPQRQDVPARAPRMSRHLLRGRSGVFGKQNNTY